MAVRPASARAKMHLSGDTTPCKVTLVILHEVISPDRSDFTRGCIPRTSVKPKTFHDQRGQGCSIFKKRSQEQIHDQNLETASTRARYRSYMCHIRSTAILVRAWYALAVGWKRAIRIRGGRISAPCLVQITREDKHQPTTQASKGGESGPLRAVHLSRHTWPGGLVN